MLATPESRTQSSLRVEEGYDGALERHRQGEPAPRLVETRRRTPRARRSRPRRGHRSSRGRARRTPPGAAPGTASGRSANRPPRTVEQRPSLSTRRSCAQNALQLRDPHLVLGVGLGEVRGVVLVVGHEVEPVTLRRSQRRLDRLLPRRPDRAGREAGVRVGVVRRGVGPLRRGGPHVARALADVGHRRVELERHALGEPVVEHARDLGVVLGVVRLVLEDARDRQHLLGGEAHLLGLGRQVERTCRPRRPWRPSAGSGRRRSAWAAPCRSPGRGSPRGCRWPRRAGRSPWGWPGRRVTAFLEMSVLSTIVFTIWRTRAPSGTTTRLWIRLSGLTRTSSASLAFISFFSW